MKEAQWQSIGVGVGAIKCFAKERRKKEEGETTKPRKIPLKCRFLNYVSMFTARAREILFVCGLSSR